MNMEMQANVYDNRPNKEALEKQREKYIQQALDWFFTKKGNDFLVQAVEVDAFGDKEKDPRNGVNLLIEQVLTTLSEKNPSGITLVETRKFLQEFPEQVIKEEMIKRGIIDDEDGILLNEILDLSEKK